MRKIGKRAFKQPWELALGSIVIISMFTVFAASLTSWLQPTEAASVGGSINVQAKLNYSLTLSLGDAFATDNCNAKANGGATVSLNPTPNNSIYFACLNALVNTDAPGGYSLNIQGVAPGVSPVTTYLNLMSGTNSIAANGTGAAVALASNTWGICIPSAYATGSAITGFGATCGGADGNTATAYNYAAVPTTPTLIKKITSAPTTDAQRNTPIRIGVRPTAALPVGTYSGVITVSASINGSGGAYTPLMQTFSATDCTNLSVGATVTLFDARDNKPYRIKKMPDNKCWMVDNLAYMGGGSNTYNDTVPMGTNGATGQLNLHTSGIGSNTTALVQSGVWDYSSFSRWIVVNTNNEIPVSGGGTRCSNTQATGTAPMNSLCGSQVIYNFCAALGLDNATTPTCAAVSNATTGTGMTNTGVVGLATSGKGGESKGDTGASAGSICPKSWRVPVGTNSAGIANEWAVLNGSMNAGTLAAANTNASATFAAYWQSNNTTGGNNPNFRSFFGTVASGIFLPNDGLGSQSIGAFWWTSSLSGGSNAYNTLVNSTSVPPGTSSVGKYYGNSVRCVFP